jgi:tape measure domain-containing protein
MAILYFKVSSDYDEVIRLRQECEKLEAQLKKMDVNKSPAAAKALEAQLAAARQQMMGLVTEAAKVGATMEHDFKNGIYNASQTVNNLSANIISQRGVIKQLQNELILLKDKYRETIKSGGDTTGMSEQIKAQTAKLREQKDALFGLTQQQAEARLSVKKLRDEYSAFKEEAGETAEVNERMTLSLTKVLGVIGGAAALKGFVSDLINVRGQFQQLEIAFSTMLKSKEAADKLMTELVDIAAKTPFDLQGVAQSAKQMIAYGSSAENVGDELVMLGNVAAGVGSQLSEIAYLYGTLRTQGRAYAVDIRQFAGRGIPIYEELAKLLGVTKDEVSGLVKEGKVGFKEVEQAFKNMTSESGIYYNLMQEQSKSLTGQISNLKDAWDSMLNKIGKETQGIASTGISTIKSLIENYETIGKILAGLIITYGTYKAACIAVTAVQALHTAGINALTVAERIHYGWLVLTEKAQRLLNATMLANPYVLLVTSVGALCVGMYNLYSSFDDVNRLSVKLQNEIDNLKDKTEQNNNTIREYLPIAKDAKESTEKREDAINKLKKAFPDYFKSLSIETSKNYDVADAVAASNEEYRKRLVLMEKLARQRYEEAKANYEKNQPKNGNIPSVMGGTTGYSQTSMSTQDLAYVKQLKAAWDTAKDAVKEYSKINSKAKTNRGPSRESSNIDKNNKNTNLGNKQFNSIHEHAQKISEIERKQAIERAKEAEELENQVEQARINAMADGSDKTIAQREYDNKKELEAIDRAKEEYIQKEIQRQKEIFDAKEDLRAKQNPKYKKRSFDSSNITVDSSSYDLLKEYTEKNQIQNEVNAQKEALNEYLKNYGTYQQKRLAISQEYSDKINKAQSEGERLSLQASMDDALSKLDFEQIKGNMNWEDVFGNLGDMTISQLERIRQQLRNMLSDGNLGLEEYKTAVEQIDKINTAIVEKNDEVKNTLGLILPMTQRRKEIEMEVAEAERTVNSLMHEMMEMQNSLNQQRESVAGYLQTSGISVGAKDIITSNFDNILSQIGGLFGEDSDIYKNVKKSFDDIAGSERKLTTTTQKLVKAQNDEYGARTKLNNFLTSFGNKLQAISDIMSLINSNIQSLPDLFSQLGVDMSSDFGKGISDLANASQSASNFIKDAMSGNFVGALSNGIGAVKGILSGFNNILGLGIGKGNVEYVTELTEKLTDSNDRLRDSIDRLKDKMDESAGGEAIKNYEQAKDAQEQLNRQTLEILKAQMSYTGAHHSNAYYWGEAIDGNAATSSRIYDSINKSLIEWLKTNPNANYSISSVNSYEDMFKLTPEQMAYIRDYNREIWNEITDIGKYDKSEYWENYADLAGQLENLTEQINENLTQVSFDSLRDSFMNTLLDMDADAQDFADDFGEYMMKSLLNYQLGDVFDEDLKKWYDDWAQMMSGQNGNLTDDQMNELKDRWEDMVDEALSMRDSIADITGYKGGSEEQQSASSKGFETMSQNAADELNGRFTALYESNLRIETSEQQQTVAITELRGNISALTAQAVGIYNIADETRTILANSYLELQEIRENTGYSAKYLKDIKADIAEVKRNTSRL